VFRAGCKNFRFPCKSYSLNVSVFRAGCKNFRFPCKSYSLNVSVFRASCKNSRFPCKSYSLNVSVFRASCSDFCLDVTVLGNSKKSIIRQVGARHPQTFGNSHILSVPCPYNWLYIVWFFICALCVSVVQKNLIEPQRRREPRDRKFERNSWRKHFYPPEKAYFWLISSQLKIIFLKSLST
jgi:hypothetical protein